MESVMTRIIAMIGLGLLLAGCAASAGYGGYGRASSGYSFGPYDGPKGDHGGVFAG
jgi:hypothetical protein